MRAREPARPENARSDRRAPSARAPLLLSTLVFWSIKMSSIPQDINFQFIFFTCFSRYQFIKRWRSSGGERTYGGTAATCWAKQSRGTGLSGAGLAACLPAKFLFCFLRPQNPRTDADDGRSSLLLVETIQSPETKVKPNVAREDG